MNSFAGLEGVVHDARNNVREGPYTAAYSRSFTTVQEDSEWVELNNMAFNLKPLTISNLKYYRLVSIKLRMLK